MKQPICMYCHKPIQKRDQLVTASNMLRIKPYHYVCFKEVEQEVSTIWNLWTPINSASGNIRFVLILIIAIWFLVTDVLGGVGDLIVLLATYPIVVRMVSFFLYEQRLPK
ncbi:hypothetical protein [Aquibacillus sediminis]|uniref:hypothetical protein n=1 Tax=Aquibacillus sediminis TaxID=2574734 RepID=UPI001109CDB8|nr:hypothetical protein [Aquibacillus sediminis]